MLRWGVEPGTWYIWITILGYCYECTIHFRGLKVHNTCTLPLSIRRTTPHLTIHNTQHTTSHHHTALHHHTPYYITPHLTHHPPSPPPSPQEAPVSPSSPARALQTTVQCGTNRILDTPCREQLDRNVYCDGSLSSIVRLYRRLMSLECCSRCSVTIIYVFNCFILTRTGL